FINSDLTAATDVTQAKRLAENADLGFIGPQKDGPLDIPNELAEAMLRATNASGHPNSDVLRPYLNGSDIVRRSRNYWIIDFGIMSQTEAAQYAAPFRYMEEKVKPIRATNNDRQRRDNWWRLGRSGEDYRLATANLSRQIFTPRVAKHRVFVWAAGNVFPDSAVAAIARQDDYFFGVLHSYLHEIWSLRLGTWLGKGNDPRYTPTSTFETYPFPVPPGKEDTTSAVYQAISAAAKQLNEERETWLNPPDLTGYGRNEKALRERTLTNLYNAVEEYRAVQGNGKNGHAKETPAHKFAPRLAELHDTLDQAVLAAYGWEDLVGRLRTPDGDEELLRRLLALNLQRAGA
ncbi:MAG: class I SAM-dependent DNA methyltransferase, partial [Anaerolineae bacterium]|nr:class I SAM-dependent DNA methyltransferase [Anaerolineae bacterium]